MNCAEYTKRASASRDNRPAWQERIGLVFHYILCVYCRRFTKQTALLADYLHRRHRDAQMPAGLREKISKNIGEKTQ